MALIYPVQSGSPSGGRAVFGDTSGGMGMLLTSHLPRAAPVGTRVLLYREQAAPVYYPGPRPWPSVTSGRERLVVARDTAGGLHGVAFDRPWSPYWVEDALSSQAACWVAPLSQATAIVGQILFAYQRPDGASWSPRQSPPWFGDLPAPTLDRVRWLSFGGYARWIEITPEGVFILSWKNPLESSCVTYRPYEHVDLSSRTGYDLGYWSVAPSGESTGGLDGDRYTWSGVNEDRTQELVPDPTGEGLWTFSDSLTKEIVMRVCDPADAWRTGTPGVTISHSTSLRERTGSGIAGITIRSGAAWAMPGYSGSLGHATTEEATYATDYGHSISRREVLPITMHSGARLPEESITAPGGSGLFGDGGEFGATHVDPGMPFMALQLRFKWFNAGGLADISTDLTANVFDRGPVWYSPLVLFL